MKESWYGLVNVGIIHPMIYPATIKGEGPFLETVTAIANDGFFGAIEIRRPSDASIKEKLKKVLEVSGIKVIIAGQPPLLVGKLNLNSESVDERKKAIEDVKKSIDDAVYFGAEKVIVLSGPHPGEEKKEEATRILIGSLKELSAYAKNKGKIFSLETFDTKIDKKCLIGSTKDSVAVAEEVKKEHDNFGLTMDLSHLPLLQETSKQALNTAKKYINHIHVGSCYVKDKGSPAYGDQHPRFGFPGGENNVESLADFIKNLFAIGYLSKLPKTNPPVLSFEVKPLPDESPEGVIANTKRVWQEAWAMI